MAAPSWTPLTDKQASLSIGSLSLDPTDPTGKTIIAGIGVTDNGEYSQFNVRNGRGGAQTGLLYTTNARRATWSALGGSTLAGMSVVDALERGNTILAATFETQAAKSATAGYGLFRSTDGGATFSAVSGAGGTGLPNAAVTLACCRSERSLDILRRGQDWRQQGSNRCLYQPRHRRDLDADLHLGQQQRHHHFGRRTRR